MTSKSSYKTNCIFFKVLSAVVIYLSVLAGVTSPCQPGPPRLLVLVMQDDTVDESTALLTEQLGLTLDRVIVIQATVSHEEFLSLPSNQQLQIVAQLVKHNGAVGAVWTQDATVSLAVFEGRGSLVRTMEASSADEVALAIYELLDESFLFEPSDQVICKEPPPQPKPKPKPVAPAECKPEPLPEEPLKNALVATVGMDQGVAGQKGKATVGVGGLLLHRNFTDHFIGRFGALARFGPHFLPTDELVTGLGLEARIESGYLWNIRSFSIGPIISAGANYTSMNLSLGQGDNHTTKWWRFRGGIGLEMGLALTKRLTVILDSTAVFSSSGKNFTRLSDGETVIKTPYLDLAFAAGLVIGI